MVQMWKEILEQPAALEKCLKQNGKTVKEAVSAIKARNIHSVVMAARGTSDHAAIYGKYVLEITAGIPVSLAAPSIFTVYGKNVNFQNSLVVAISQSGKAADALEVLRAANRQGALTISITNFPDSPLAREAMFHLCCEAGPELSVAATKTFTTEMMLLALLAAEWSDDRELMGELFSVPERMSHVFDISSTVEEQARRYRYINECFVLSRGVNFAIALESALKIQETTYTRAKAFATSDFQHGPIAMADRDLPVIIYAPDGPSAPYTAEMIERLKPKQMDLIIISNRKDLLASAASAFAIPETNNDIVSPYFNAAVAQMFACRLSLEKGLNPDQPRELNKVTVTK